MNVPAEVRKRVEEKITTCLAIIEKKYGRQLKRPIVSYNLKGKVGGYASAHKWQIRLNAVLLMENLDHFIARTVPHELAHLVTATIYPEAHEHTGTQKFRRANGRVVTRRVGREPHGEQWQSVMRAMGEVPSRCHQYDTTNSKVKKSGLIDITCCNCGKDFSMRPKSYEKLTKNPSQYSCRCSKAPNLFLKGFTTVEQAKVAYAKIKAITPPPVAAAHRSLNGESKLDICRRIYAANRHRSRGDILALFQGDAGCTKAGASTYYYTISK